MATKAQECSHLKFSSAALRRKLYNVARSQLDALRQKAGDHDTCDGAEEDQAEHPMPSSVRRHSSLKDVVHAIHNGAKTTRTLRNSLLVIAEEKLDDRPLEEKLAEQQAIAERLDQMQTHQTQEDEMLHSMMEELDTMSEQLSPTVLAESVEELHSLLEELSRIRTSMEETSASQHDIQKLSKALEDLKQQIQHLHIGSTHDVDRFIKGTRQLVAAYTHLDRQDDLTDQTNQEGPGGDDALDMLMQHLGNDFNDPSRVAGEEESQRHAAKETAPESLRVQSACTDTCRCSLCNYFLRNLTADNRSSERQLGERSFVGDDPRKASSWQDFEAQMVQSTMAQTVVPLDGWMVERGNTPRKLVRGRRECNVRAEASSEGAAISQSTCEWGLSHTRLVPVPLADRLAGKTADSRTEKHTVRRTSFPQRRRLTMPNESDEVWKLNINCGFGQAVAGSYQVKPSLGRVKLWHSPLRSAAGIALPGDPKANCKFEKPPTVFKTSLAGIMCDQQGHGKRTRDEPKGQLSKTLAVRPNFSAWIPVPGRPRNI